jgi:hypothetical protein
MSGSWAHTHRRYELTTAVLIDIERSGVPMVPPKLRAAVDAEFGDLGVFLAHVQCRWYRILDARIDDELGDLAAQEWPSRLLLEAYDGHPALLAGQQHRHRRMIELTGHDSYASRELSG